MTAPLGPYLLLGVNLLLATAFWLVVGRGVVNLIVPLDRPNLFTGLLNTVTGPVIAGVRAVTPQLIPPPLLVPLAAIWLVLLRLVTVGLIAFLAAAEGGGA